MKKCARVVHKNYCLKKVKRKNFGNLDQKIYNIK
jgi:hypothetical protein